MVESVFPNIYFNGVCSWLTFAAEKYLSKERDEVTLSSLHLVLDGILVGAKLFLLWLCLGEFVSLVKRPCIQLRGWTDNARLRKIFENFR